MGAIGIFAEIIDNTISNSLGSMVEFGLKVKEASGSELVLFAVGQDMKEKEAGLKAAGVDRLVLMDIPGVSYVQTDKLSCAVAELLDKVDFSTILVPASHTARSLFARVAMKKNIGMTADCTDLDTEIVDGKPVVHQIKPSFGAQIMVTCDVEGDCEIITMRTDDQVVPDLSGDPAVEYVEFSGAESAIEVVDFEKNDSVNSLHSAEVVVCAGRGAMDEERFDMVKKYAEKIGAAVAGSRPMADNGWIPFENQVGQSGTVIRPKVAITFGVSGAIQFTEGLKGNPLIIAVNSDEHAPIFGFADYAVIADMSEVLPELLK